MLNQLASHDGLLNPEFENIYKWYNKYPLTHTTSITSSTTLTELQAGLLLGDTSGGAVTSTLPPASGNLGLTFVFKLVDNTNPWTIARSGTDLIDGATSLVLTQLYRSIILRSDGSDWVIISGLDANPAGVILPYGGTSAPTGYLMCDGSSLLRADYPALYAAIGTAFGTADGTHFNLPDYRGRFIRGVDHAQARDPDAAGRTAMAAGGNTGDAVGSVQAYDTKAHYHNFPNGYANYNSTAAGASYPNTWTGHAGSSIGALLTTTWPTSGGNETRPINAYCEFIIKY